MAKIVKEILGFLKGVYKVSETQKMHFRERKYRYWGDNFPVLTDKSSSH